MPISTMPSLWRSSAYSLYRGQKKEELQLPLFDEDSDNQTELYVGERYCRVKSCGNDNCFDSTNSLRKHYKAKHPNTLKEGGRGGRPKVDDEARALTWYQEIEKAFNERQIPALPLLPMKRDGINTNVTEMRKQVREMNHKIPCERCKEDKKSSDCCRISRSDDCDHFELFQPLRSRSEYDPASPPTAPIVE